MFFTFLTILDLIYDLHPNCRWIYHCRNMWPCDVNMDVGKEPEFTQGGHWKFEEAKQRKHGGGQQPNETQQCGSWVGNREVREAAAACSQKIQWVLISVASFWTCQFNYDASQLTAMHLEPTKHNIAQHWKSRWWPDMADPELTVSRISSFRSPFSLLALQQGLCMCTIPRSGPVDRCLFLGSSCQHLQS